MRPPAFARAAPEQLAVDRAGATAIGAFLIRGPKINALKTRIAFDHTFDVVTRVMGHGLNGDVVARIHLESIRRR
jgi:hypothetical protein